jgi:hypothetical protein
MGEDVNEGPAISVHGATIFCKEMDKFCSQFPNVDGASTLELQWQLRLMCGHLCHLDFTSRKQVTLETYFERLEA